MRALAQYQKRYTLKMLRATFDLRRIRITVFAARGLFHKVGAAWIAPPLTRHKPNTRDFGPRLQGTLNLISGNFLASNV